MSRATLAPVGLRLDRGVDDVALPDGAHVDVRPIGPADVGRLRRMFDRLSPLSVYYRFFAPIRRPRPGVVEHLVASRPRAPRGPRRASSTTRSWRSPATRAATRGTRIAELAVTVEDAWQHRGSVPS